jgi:hypothetical protein
MTTAIGRGLVAPSGTATIAGEKFLSSSSTRQPDAVSGARARPRFDDEEQAVPASASRSRQSVFLKPKIR